MPSSTSKTSMIGRVITITHCYGCGRSKHVLKLERELGSGACGTVYEAVDLTSRSGARYAVKHTHRTDLLEDEVGAHSLCSDSPGVVTLHDFIEDGPRNAFVVMDLVRGGDLFDALQEIHSRDFYRKDAHIKQIALQLIDALSYCHTRGVFHRDLKPENILISEDGKQVYITDFGFAYGKHACHQFGYGSVPYMSPGKAVLLTWCTLI
jgi:serine/threonine protein kinase